MADFFIGRPVFAWVVAIMITLAGLLSIHRLPVTQYPEVAPPAIMVSGFYPGSSPQNIEDTVVQVIERQMTGLDGFRYMSTAVTATGNFELVITFNQGINPDIAQVQVQNKLQLALPSLPSEVQAQGVAVSKYQQSYMLIISLYSEDGSVPYDELADYLVSNLKEPVARTQGVGEVLVWASQYAARVWLIPEALVNYRLVPADVVKAIENQNIQIAAGQLGGLPARHGVRLNASVISKSPFTKIEQFEEILLKVNQDGSQVRLKDVATVTLGSESYSYTSTFNGHPGAVMAVRLAPDGNILAATSAVEATIKELEPQFPPNTRVAFSNQIAPTVRASIQSIALTLVEAVLLVSLVMWVFLQNIRTTIITVLTIPIVLLGTFTIVALFGLTINIITLLALILAIGLLVDDTIVVVENVERIIGEENLSPVEATRKSMKQLQSALVGIALVISAVFFPMAFFSGSTGAIYRQFSVAIIGAMGLSVFIALSLTPALCATILRGSGQAKSPGKIFTGFNFSLLKMTEAYTTLVARCFGRKKLYLAVFGLVILLIVILNPRLQTAFLPNEDQGLASCMIELPANSSLEQTEAVVAAMNDYFLKEEESVVYSIVGVAGFSYAGQGQNVGQVWLTLLPFKERKADGQSVFALARRAGEKFVTMPDAKFQFITPASITELGNSSGFNFFLQDRAGLGHPALMRAKEQFLQTGWMNPSIGAIWTNSLADQPQYQILIDDEKALTTIEDLSEVHSTISTAWGAAYVNDFVHNGRLKKVYVQAAENARVSMDDFQRWHVRGASGEMVPFSSFTTGKWVMGPPKLERFNGFPAVEFLGFGQPGVSTGEAMDTVIEISGSLPDGVRLSFANLSYEEIEAGSQVYALYALSLLAVFLCLAALYESWVVPFSVMAVMPFGFLGAMLAMLFTGLPGDVYFRVGILIVMGLSAKNAILLVEFAHTMFSRNEKPLAESIVSAARVRLRPIIMTSAAFIFGVVPLIFASGASSASQKSLGTSVIGGTILATLLVVLFVPLFYSFMAKFLKKSTPAARSAEAG